MPMILHVGMSASGKTWALQRLAESRARSGSRVLVLDRLHEWARLDGTSPLSVPVGVASTNDGVEHFFRQGAVQVLVYKPADIFESTRQDVLSPSDDLLREACTLARFAMRHGCTIITPEVHRIAPNGPRLPRMLDEMAGAGRHYGGQWWADTQRLALCSTRLRDQVTSLRVFSLHGRAERKVLRDDYDDEMASSVDECARRHARGEHGWHVLTDPRNRFPPYPIQRFMTDGSVVTDEAASDSKGAEVSKGAQEDENDHDSGSGHDSPV